MKKFKLWFLWNFNRRAYRFHIYQWMFEYLSSCKELGIGFCYSLIRYNSSNDDYYIWQLEELSELVHYKPQKFHHGGFWFASDTVGRQQRLDILKEILLTK